MVVGGFAVQKVIHKTIEGFCYRNHFLITQSLFRIFMENRPHLEVVESFAITFKWVLTLWSLTISQKRNTVVAHDIPSNCVVGGVPTIIIKD